ncbi:SMP-30/gluconolactonase/LRE family protein [Massilia sp. IC2-476]|uniref:SMP-30/gluconolactonase/LRE family protein n=1 Tax=Massilia sp. IC2-476 TaxID=2887199 RepID=UPI001D11C59B|nr:SMP-30/gluconolactonase/LRE family protein [Massilia sp. IC2-476]MCC2973621.1 SMP-30/gluconolactonase/LRE family protein [Massilia sp. IC2-476]
MSAAVRRLACASLALFATNTFAASCGAPPSGELKAERLASVTPSRTEPGLYEGPVWVGDALYFSDFSFAKGFPSRVRKLAADGTVSTLIEDSGSNGLAVDGRGELVLASHKDKALVRLDRHGKRVTIAGSFKGNVFNSPNDIAIARDGSIYFTDPDWQKAAAPGGQPVTGIYRVGTDGAVTLVDGSRRNPNGIALLPAGDVLYVNASDGLLMAYPIVKGGPQAGRALVRDLQEADGMTLDCHGNLYVTEHGSKRVRVFSPQGRQLATIRVDANITNAAFGGKDGKTLYMTGAGALWRLPLDVGGMPY